MLIMIVVLVLVLAVLLLKLGPTGRFFLESNLLYGSKEFLLSKSHTNRLKFFRVKSNGRALQISNTRYMFLPDLKRNPDKDEQMFNDLIKRPSTLDGRIMHMGSDSVSVAVNPSILEALSTAKIGTDIVKNFFKGFRDLETVVKKSRKDYVFEINRIKILAPYQIQDIAELMNIVITPQRLAMVFREGELKGKLSGKIRENVLMFVILILAGCVAVMTFFLSKGLS